MGRSVLEEHIHISYLARSVDERILTEERGYVPNLDKYIQCFKKALPEKFTSGKTFFIEDDAFESIPDPFFKNILIRVTVTYKEDLEPKDERALGRYLPKSSFFFEKVKKLYNPRIYLDCVVGTGSSIVTKLAETFAHELTHCWEDYQRELKGKRSLAADYTNTTYKEDAKPAEKILKSILYFLNKQEQHAWVGSLRATLQNGTLDQLRTSEGIMSLIEDTVFYENYRKIKRWVEQLQLPIRENTKALLVRTYQEVYPDNTRVKNFHDLVKVVTSRWEKWNRKFESSVGKIAYDVYVDKKGESKVYEDPILEDFLKEYWTNVTEVL